MQNELITGIRVVVSTAVSVVVTFLASRNLMPPGLESEIEVLIASASIILGSGLYFYISRLLEKHVPWLKPLVLSNPDAPQPKSRFSKK